MLRGNDLDALHVSGPFFRFMVRHFVIFVPPFRFVVAPFRLVVRSFRFVVRPRHTDEPPCVLVVRQSGEIVSPCVMEDRSFRSTERQSGKMLRPSGKFEAPFRFVVRPCVTTERTFRCVVRPFRSFVPPSGSGSRRFGAAAGPADPSRTLAPLRRKIRRSAEGLFSVGGRFQAASTSLTHRNTQVAICPLDFFGLSDDFLRPAVTATRTSRDGSRRGRPRPRGRRIGSERNIRRRNDHAGPGLHEVRSMSAHRRAAGFDRHAPPTRGPRGDEDWSSGEPSEAHARQYCACASRCMARVPRGWRRSTTP